MFILGLESSCDDCSAAVVCETQHGPKLLSLTRKNQDSLHSPYGGVVPELAAREHLLCLNTVISDAIIQSGILLSSINKVAVTQGPGLIGSLLTTFSASKSIAWRYNIPWIGVHHIIGHLNAARFDYPNLPFPALAIIVSGGHTHLYLAKSWTKLELLQKTRDDAAGEAFDKVARMLNLGYPGGPAVDTCASMATYMAEPFNPPKFRDKKASWSFSGLKTAVRMRIQNNSELQNDININNPAAQALCLSFQKAVTDWLMQPISKYKELTFAKSLIVSGGVACNSHLRNKAMEVAEKLRLTLAIPAPRLCTDNGAMIAAAGALLELEEHYSEKDAWYFNVDPNLPLT